MEKRGKDWILIASAVVIFIAAVVLVGWIWISSYSKDCADESCFESSLEKCSRAVWINEAEDASWGYGINGRGFLCTLNSNLCGECIVNVKLLQVKGGSIDLEKLNGRSMDCYLPFGYAANPQEDLSRCHGILKEEMQDMIIRKMHSYILTNVGRISEELSRAV